MNLLIKSTVFLFAAILLLQNAAKAQNTISVNELPFGNELLRVDWKANSKSKAEFDSTVNQISRMLINAYENYSLGFCLEKGLDVTY